MGCKKRCILKTMHDVKSIQISIEIIFARFLSVPNQSEQRNYNTEIRFDSARTRSRHPSERTNWRESFAQVTGKKLQIIAALRHQKIAFTRLPFTCRHRTRFQCPACAPRNTFHILINQTEIRVYLPFSD